MKAIQIYQYGSAEQLKYEDTTVPTISDNQLLIKVYATSANHLEIKKASGAMKERMPLSFPWIPGYDFAGIVEQTGKAVTTFKKGDKVYGNCNGGSYAEFLAADEEKTVLMPDNLSFNQASSVPHVAETAWQALYKHGQLKEGQTVLVHGGAGAVGAFAVQFARITGAKVLATAAGEDIEFVKSLGANEVIDFSKQDFSKTFSHVDLVLSLVGGDVEKNSYTIMNRGGRLVSTVGIAHQDIAEKMNVATVAMVIEQSAKDLSQITELINAGKVATDIGITYPLKEAITAWKVLTGDKTIKHPSHGKIILEVRKEG